LHLRNRSFDDKIIRLPHYCFFLDMNTDLLAKIEKPYLKTIAKFDVGDTVEVYYIVREGEKSRIQVFKGIVISIKGSGTRKMFMVRKISYGIGVEKIFPLYSPNIEKVVIVKRGDVRRSKLYYMRKRIGKRAMKVDEGEVSEDSQFTEYGDYIVPDEPEKSDESEQGEKSSESDDKDGDDKSADTKEEVTKEEESKEGKEKVDQKEVKSKEKSKNENEEEDSKVDTNSK